MVKQLENNSYVTIVRRHEDIIQEQTPAFKRKRFGQAWFYLESLVPVTFLITAGSRKAVRFTNLEKLIFLW